MEISKEARADRAFDDPAVNKDVSIKLRITSAEHEAWQRAADSEGESLSNWIRRRCNGLAAADPQLEHIARGVAASRKPKSKRRRS